MIAALAIVSIYAAAMTFLWRVSAASVSDLMGRWIRANGQFVAADAELNALKGKYALALMRLEDARR